MEEPRKRITTTAFGQCRCCLTNGYHRDIMKEQLQNGHREVYYDIFAECFNLYLSSNMNISTLICSMCVQRLHDAHSFRTMVVESERRLLNIAGDKETLSINLPHMLEDVEVKCEDLKVELSDGDHEDSELVIDDQYMQDEGVEPVVDFVSESDGLVEGEAALLARFQTAELKKLPNRERLMQICPTFVKQLDLLKDKQISHRMLSDMLTKDDNVKLKTEKTIYVTEKYAHMTNAAVLLEFSNATPFKSKSKTGYPCFYCRNSVENLEKLIDHQRKMHKKSEIRKILSTYGAECLVVYADITDLKCTICNKSIPNMNELKSHLTKTHSKKMYLDYTDRVIPFKLSDRDNNIFNCQICGFNFETFGSIERHMNVHYRNHVCKQCGTGFITKYRLKVHTKSMHVEGSFPCELCKKIFASSQKHKNHVDTVHKMIKRFKCTKCPERFSEYFRRQKHMVMAHGVAPLKYKCNVCEKAFDRRYTLSRHLKRDHLEERDFQCEMCSYKCFTNNELRVHMIKHNGERIFECSVCKKSYARKKTLREHMRIHNNDRRFSCLVCGQAFVQKCSLKGHIKTHHLEYSMQEGISV